MDLILILRYCAPVALAALGETLNQKAGSLNIGLEGMMLTSAFFSAWVSLATGSVWLGLGVGVFASLILMAVQSLFTINIRADQVVVGTAVNLFALGLTGTLFRSNFNTRALTGFPTLPKIGALDPVLLSLVVLFPALIWILNKTKWGLVVRAAGEYPDAVEAAGFHVQRVRWAASLVAAALAGLAGAYLTLGFTGSFNENMTAGRGFVAIAMVTFGRWKPGWVLAGSMLVGLLEAAQFSLQSRQSSIPYPLLNALPYVVALAVLVIAGRGRGAPAALGTPWRGRL